MLYTTHFLGVLGLVSAAAAATHDIQVGMGGLKFTPDTTTAAVGDTVVFHYYPGHHDVVQGAFASPCAPLSGGFFSGFIDSTSGAASNVFTVTINDTNPIWMYCSQVSHCQGGMAAVINPPSTGDTLAAYIAAAALTSSSTAPPAVAGGVISAGSSSASGSSSSASSSAASSSAASSATSSSTQTANGYGGGSTASATPAQSTGGASGITKGRNTVLSAGLAAVALVAGWVGLS